ncbi:MAG: arylsulfatase [Limnochordia bacterium]|jgi:arylsulfatase|nr:arylsulfatase [Limnochordia bacterium]
MRGDCLGVAGHPVVETPNLDHLASTGVRFSRAYSATPTCIAARASILTGLKQEHHGRVGYQDGVPWHYPITLPGELARAGYHTQGIGKMHFHPPRSLQGFHNVVLHDGYLHYYRRSERGRSSDDYIAWLREKAGPDVDYAEHGIDCNSWMARPWHLPERLHPTNWVVHESIRFLQRRDPDKPFFLWMSFVRPHAPLDPPEYYLNMYLQRDLPLPPIGDWVAADVPQNPGLPTDAGIGQLREHELRRLLAGYYGCITHIDHQIGRFLKGLYENNVLDNTLILFTSDHGELLGDHHLFRKSLPYEGSARIPMILHLPRSYSPRRAGVYDVPVELRDILPTMLEAAECTIPPSVDGMSFLSYARGETPKWRDYIHGEHAHGGASNHWLTDGKEKYIWFSQTGREQLFDLRSDPLELHDLVQCTDAKPRLEHWRRIMVQELQHRPEGYVQNGSLVTGRPVSALIPGIFK